VTGGIQGVYSGQGRGNRYSLRLAYVDSAMESGDEMVADSVETVLGDEVCGEIRATGKVLDAAGQPVATFVTVYRLTRGSRWLDVSTRLTPAPSLELGEDPWKSYFALRSAVASDALTLFVPLRDQFHRVGTGKWIDSPGGVVIDEVERQTLLFADGRPAHRKVGDRFIDSLLIVRGETARDFKLSVGFDVRHPSASLRAAACPPARLAVRSVPSSPVGWLVNCPTDDVVLADVRLASADPLVVSMLVITTRPESRKVKLRFCRDCESAEIETGNVHAPRKAVKHEGDRVDLSMAGHETLRLWVTLKA
jgi:alpha-mannosidase